MSYQNDFVGLLKTRNPNVSLADVLADILSISKDSAYRRLRDETPFTLEETIKVCEHFQLNPAELMDREAIYIPFRYNPLYSGNHNFLEYFKRSTQIIDMIGQANGLITYAAEDIPLFLHFAYPKLMSFKLFYWMKAVLDDKTFEDRSFDPELIHPDIKAQSKEFLEVYNRCNSIEIWTNQSILSTIRQIIFYMDSFQFKSKEDAMDILDELTKLLKDLEVKAANRSKLPDGTPNFTLYNSEVMIGNNTVIMEGLPRPIVFLSHNTFNSVSTQDEAFFKETKTWANNLIGKSVPISGVSEKHRVAFFRYFHMTIEKARQKIALADF